MPFIYDREDAIVPCPAERKAYVEGVLAHLQEDVDDALDALTRLIHGDPRFATALQEFEDAQLAICAFRARWVR